MTSAQQKQVITALEASSATKALTAGQIQERLATELNSKEDAKALLINSGIVTQKELEENATIQVTAAKLNEAVANGTLSASDAGVIAGALGITGVNTGAAISFDVLTAAIIKNIKYMGLWLVSNPVGWLTLTAGSIFGLVKVIDLATTSTSEYEEKLDNLKSEYNEITSQIESVNSELQTTIDRMKELEGKDSLTFTEKEEYDNLVKTNNELQRKIDLLELEEKQKNKEKNKTFVDTMESDVNKNDERVFTGNLDAHDNAETEYITEEELIQRKFEKLAELRTKFKNAATDYQKEALQKEITDIENYLKDKNNEWKTVSEGIDYIENPTTEDDKKVNEWLDYINDFQDRMAIAMSRDDASSNAQYKTNTFNRIVDNWQFDETVQGLQDLGKEGKVTAEMLNDPKYDEFINKLVFLGVIDSADNLEDVALAFNSVANSAENATDATGDFTDKTDINFSNILALKTSDDEADDKATALSKLKDEVDKITSSYKSLKNALNEYRTTGAVSLSTLEELMEAGDDWLNYLSVEDGQLKINEQAYHDMAQAKLYELKVQALQNLSNQVKSLENVASAQKWIESQNYNTADSYKTLTDSIVQETLAELEAKRLSSKSDDEKAKWQEAIDSYKQQANAIIEITSIVSDNASSVSDALTNAKQTADLINTVTKEIQENGKISVSTLQSISSTYPVLEKYVMDYMDGIEGSQKELINQLNQLYTQDVNNYKEAWLIKSQDDKTFWVDFQNNAAETVNKFADQYGIDLKNFDSYAQAKIALSEKIQKALVKVLEADNYVNQKTNSNDITKSAEVAGLTSDQKRNAENLWIKWKNEYLDAKMNGEKYSITEDQMARILERSGGLNNGSAKQLAQTLYTNLVHLSIDSGRSYYDSLIEESKHLESAFDQYSAQYTDKASVAINNPSEFNSSSKETFDWIETEISRLTKALDTLKTKADNTYASWSSRNTALSQAISKTEELIRKQSQAYNRYMQEANSVGLSSHYKNLVQNGAMDISKITDETLKKKIKEYQDWYEKAQDCLATQQDLNAELDSFKSQKFDNIKSEYDAIRERTEAQKELIESQITLLSTASDYNNLRTKQSSVISQLQNERKTLSNVLNTSGIQAYTEEWYNLTSQVEDFDKQIVDAKNALKEIDTLQFDNLKQTFENNLGILETTYSMMEKQISLLSTSGDYNNLRNTQKSQLAMLKEELKVLTNTYNSFNIQKGTDQWYEMNEELNGIREKIQDTEIALKEIDSLQFDNLKSTFDFDMSRLEHVMNILQDEIDLLEMKGLYVSESYYDGMKTVIQKEIDTLSAERTQLASMLQNSAYQKGTKEWNDMFSTLMDVDKELSSLTNTMTEYNNAIRDLNWEVFEYLEESVGRITDETEYLIDLLSKDKLFDKENGNLNANGIATIGLHATAYEVYKQQAQDYYEEVQGLQEQLVSGAGKDVLEQYNKMVEAHRNAILAAEDEKQAILDLLNDGFQAQFDALNELIKKRQEALNAEKNLYDYQKSIKEKTDNISSLEKQKLAYEGDNSEEAISKIQQIKVQLSEAKSDLEETEYEQYLQDTQNMLDTLASDYESWMNNRLDHEDALLESILGSVDSQSANIMDTLNNVASQYGTMISDNIYNVFGSETATAFSTTLTSAIGNAAMAMGGSVYSSANAVNALIAENSAITNGYISSVGDGINGNLGSIGTGVNDVNGTLGLTNQHLSDLYANVGGLNNPLGNINTGVGNINNSINGVGNSVTSAISGTQNAITSLLSQLITATNSKVTATAPTADYKHTPVTSSTSSPSTSSGGSSSDSIFIKKVDSYPKSKLQTNTSIVDRLKYNDFDSSFSARASYYSKMGGTGTYTGSSSQNTWMIKKMKEMGYKKGTKRSGKELTWTQEGGGELIRTKDGAILTPLDNSMVFNNEASQKLWEFSQNPSEYLQKLRLKNITPQLNFVTPTLPNITPREQNVTMDLGDINIEMNLPNATDYMSIRKALVQDGTFKEAFWNELTSMPIKKMGVTNWSALNSGSGVPISMRKR